MSINHNPQASTEGRTVNERLALASRVAQQDARLQQLEALLQSELSDATRGHLGARHLDARVKLSPGDVRTTVIMTSPAENDGRTGVCKLEKIYTFVHPNGHSIEPGTTVRVKVSDVGESHAEAIALEISDEEVGADA